MIDEGVTDYWQYLKQLHDKNSTPIELISAAVKEATGHDIDTQRRIVAGEVSEVYDIGIGLESNVIVRITNGEKPEYEQERWALEECKKVGGIPIPEILLIKHIPEDGKIRSICIQKKLPGDVLERGSIDFDSFDKNRKRRIINRAGEILSRIHSVAVDGFGRIDGKGKGEVSSFQEVMRGHLKHIDDFMKIADEAGIDRKVLKQIFEVLEAQAHVAPNIQPILSHNDFNTKHIMIGEDDEVTGIIDWGDVCGDTPLGDFAQWDY